VGGAGIFIVITGGKMIRCATKLNACLLVAAMLASILMTGCVPKNQVREERPEKYFPTTSSELSLPESVGVFSRGEVSTYADPRLGVGVNYASSVPGVKADLYVYPVVLPALYSLADINEIEFRQAVADVLTVSPGAEVQQISEFSGSLGGVNYEALKARIKLDGSTKADSYVYLGVSKDAYIKIRFTELEALAGKIDPDEFARNILTGVAFDAAEKHVHPLHVTVTRGSMDIAKGVQGAVGYTILLGIQLREQISQGHFLDSFQREYTVWNTAYHDWQKVYEQKMGEQPSGTFIDALRDVQQDGYMREYIWNYFRRPYWREPDGLKMSEFKIWAETHLSGHVAPVNHGVLIDWGTS